MPRFNDGRGARPRRLGSPHGIRVVRLRLAGDRANLLRPVSMEPDDDPLARVRAQRRKALTDELLPKLRRLNPVWTDEEIFGTAESMADLRLLDEEIG